MSLLPPTANHLSRGSLASVWVLGLSGPLGNLVPAACTIVCPMVGPG